jgi:glycosyltransferase involved in cell wall biosynthesis
VKIALFSDYFPPHLTGGVERVVDELSGGLASRGHDVRVFTLNTQDAAPYEEDGNLRVYRAGAFQMTRLLKLQSAFSPQLLLKALQELRADPPDLIHAHSRFFFSSLVAASLSAVLRRPLVTTLHVGSLDDMPLRFRLPVLAYERTLSKAILYQSQRLIAVSEAVADYATSRLGVSKDKLTVVPNAVDTALFRPKRNAYLPCRSICASPSWGG